MTLPGATVRSIEVQPGYFVLADDDGAIAITSRVVEEVLGGAEEMGERERDIRAELASALARIGAPANFGHA
jgi:4-hydroxy-4-methyl-2-oxoglutarate aldolase